MAWTPLNAAHAHRHDALWPRSGRFVTLLLEPNVQELQSLCTGIGLWIARVRELEGSCISIGCHGPAWVQQVVEERSLADDSELEGARKCVRAM